MTSQEGLSSEMDLLDCDWFTSTMKMMTDQLQVSNLHEDNNVQITLKKMIKILAYFKS